MIKNALINEDGSVIDFWGNEILPPDEDRAITYSKMKDFKNAWVNGDGSVVKIVRAGGGTGESTPNIAIEYDTETGKVWVTDKEGKKESVNSIKLDTITDKNGNRLEEILNNIVMLVGNPTVLYDSVTPTPMGTIITLSDSVDNYDYIEVIGGFFNKGVAGQMQTERIYKEDYFREDWGNVNQLRIINNSVPSITRRILFGLTSDRTIYIDISDNAILVKVIGFKTKSFVDELEQRLNNKIDEKFAQLTENIQGGE